MRSAAVSAPDPAAPDLLRLAVGRQLAPMRRRQDLRAAPASNRREASLGVRSAAVSAPDPLAPLLRPAVGRQFAPMHSQRDLRPAPASRLRKASVKVRPRCPMM